MDDPAAAVEDRPVSLPTGRYIFVGPAIPADYGGLTASMFARARAFVAQAGQPVTIVTFPPMDDFVAFEAGLRERGVLPAEGVDLRSLHHEYELRSYGPGDRSPRAARRLPTHERKVATNHAPGVPWRVDLLAEAGGERIAEDYLRQDGTAYMRRHVSRTAGGGEATALIECLDHEGGARERYRTVPALYRGWLSQVAPAGEGPTFLVIDGAAGARHLLPFERPDIYRFFAVHNTHIEPPGRYDGKLGSFRAHMFYNLHRVDGMILLTEWQKEDVALREGRRDNLFVVPHAAHPLAQLPDPSLRNPHQAVIVGRLVTQKRVEHAIRAFRLVVDQVPDASLDVFGSGYQEGMLRTLTKDLGLTGSVHLHGHAPGAARHFGSAAAALLTSAWEGQGLVVLEAMSAGCPVVAYDVKYGPSDMIRDGVDGLLVPNGDIEGLAAGVVALFTDAGRAREMSRRAWERSFDFDERRMVQQWDAVLSTALRQRDSRVSLKDVRWTSVDTDQDGSGDYLLRVCVDVTGEVPPSAREDWRFTWLVIGRASGRQWEVPVEVEAVDVRGSRWSFRLVGRLGLAEAETRLDDDDAGVLDIYLDLVWNNAHWRDRLPAVRTKWGVDLYTTLGGRLSLRLPPPGTLRVRAPR